MRISSPVALSGTFAGCSAQRYPRPVSSTRMIPANADSASCTGPVLDRRPAADQVQRERRVAVRAGHPHVHRARGLPLLLVGAGDAGRADAVRRPHQGAHPAGHRPGALRGDHAVPLDQPAVDAEHVDLRLGGVAHHPTEEGRGRAGRLGEQHGQPAAGERLRHGHRLAAILQQPLRAMRLAGSRAAMLAHVTVCSIVTRADRRRSTRSRPRSPRPASFGRVPARRGHLFLRTTLIVRSSRPAWWWRCRGR